MTFIALDAVSCHVCGYRPPDGDSGDGWLMQTTTVVRPRVTEDDARECDTSVSLVCWACPECGPAVLRHTVSAFGKAPLTHAQREELAREM